MEDTRNQSDLEDQFTEQKLRYQVRELTEEENINRNFYKYKQQLVLNELNEINNFYLLLNPNFKPTIDYIYFKRVEYTVVDYNIKPSYIKKINHYKKLKYVLMCILRINEPLSGNVVLYDNPTLPIIDKPEPIDLEKVKNLRPDRFPCNFEKVYNESDFSKYLNVHYHKIKNRHNLDHIKRLNNKDTVFVPLHLR